MNHLTKIIEEEKKAFEELYPPVTIGYDGNETDYFRREKFLEILDQAMQKAALAVLDELEWKNKGFHSGSEVVTWSDEKREEIKSTLTKE